MSIVEQELLAIALFESDCRSKRVPDSWINVYESERDRYRLQAENLYSGLLVKSLESD